MELQGCQQCHAVRGQGLEYETPVVARDLGERMAPTYGPHTLSSALWNHTTAASLDSTWKTSETASFTEC